MTKRSESGRSGKDAVPVKREEAGLLWRLLPPASREKIARFLTSGELKRLNDAYQEYRRRGFTERFQIETALLRDSRSEWGAIPALVFIAGLLGFLGLVAAHRSMFPQAGFEQLSQILAPLAIAIFSPLAFYLLPVYRARVLFRLPSRPADLGLIVLSFVALTWVLSFIDLEDMRMKGSLGLFNLAVVGVGAAAVPVLEEIFFREVVPSAVGRDPNYLGHILSALIFAAAHLPTTPAMALLYVAAAAILSALRIETGGLFGPVAAHSAANVTILLVGA